MKTFESAYDWGVRHMSCPEALDWRMSLGENATQADAWQACERGDWLIWQWEHCESYEAEMQKAVENIVSRSIRRAQKSLRGVTAVWVTVWRKWAREWLSGTDRTKTAAADAAYDAADAAYDAAYAAAYAAAAYADAANADAANAADCAAYATNVAADTWQSRKAELKLQARDIRREIPEWPGE